MNDRGILIADADTRLRGEMADFFSSRGYMVETSDSAVHAFCSILQKKIPVLLLGSEFDRSISPAELVRLLKMCNRHLAIIVVSEKMLLPQERRMRENGIFYHALKPGNPGDTGEIGEAVECAFRTISRSPNGVEAPLSSSHKEELS